MTDVTDPVVAALRRRVVDPVVGSLFTPAEFDDVTIGWGSLPAGGEVWVRVVARGELAMSFLVGGGADLGDRSVVADAAARLASDLEDFVCETRLGWAQHRIARCEVPD